MFKVTNGCKQGGCLSPWIYGQYTTALICVANESQLGIKLVHMTVAVSAFADDLMLITDDYNNAQKLVNLIGSQV